MEPEKYLAMNWVELIAHCEALEARCREQAVLLDQANRHKQGRGQYLDEARKRIAELETSLEKYQACRVHDVDEKAWLSKRMTELEARSFSSAPDPELNAALARIAELEAQCASKDRVIADLDFNVFPKLDDRIKQLESRCIAMAWLIPGETLVGDLQETANRVRKILETGSAANATTPGECPSTSMNGAEPGASDGDLACPAALPSSAKETK